MVGTSAWARQARRAVAPDSRPEQGISTHPAAPVHDGPFEDVPEHLLAPLSSVEGRLRRRRLATCLALARFSSWSRFRR